MRARRQVLLSGALTVAAVAGALVAMPSATAAGPALAEVRTATAAFHSVARAEKAGYAPFLDCFDHDTGGMGQHYLNDDLLDDGGAVDPQHPETMVYEVRDGKLTLVAVEWIVWQSDVSAPPTMFGNVTMHPFGPFYVLHAWVWKDNPVGLFADWNPDVAACP